MEYIPSEHPLEDMIRIYAKNLELTDPIRQYIHKKIRPLLKHFPKIYDVHMELSLENAKTKVKESKIEPRVKAHKRKIQHHVKAHIRVPPDMNFNAEAFAEEMYGSIDLVCKKLDNQVIKHKERLHKRSDKVTALVKHRRK